MENINIYAFSDEAGESIDHQIIALKRNGLRGMEIRNVDGENISDISYEKAKEVKEKLDKNDLLVWSIGSPIGKINITDDFTSHIEKFKRTLDIAEILAAPNIRLFSFYTPKGEDPGVYKDEVFERLDRFVEVAKNYNVTLCHENEKAIFGDTHERCLEIHKQFPTIKGIFDPANYVQCSVNTLEAWAMLKDYIHYMHIKDATADGFVVPAGNGVGNVGAVAKDFIKLGGKDFTIEPHLTLFSGFAKLEQEEDAMHAKFMYSDSDTSFDIACNSFKNLI
jgi:sugar phosphate isomerase/epimerase